MLYEVESEEGSRKALWQNGVHSGGTSLPMQIEFMGGGGLGPDHQSRIRRMVYSLYVITW